MTTPTLVLASASPARHRLLESIGIHPMVQPSNFDESQVQSTDVTELVNTLAWGKAETIAQQLKQTISHTPQIVLGCDSVLAVNGEIHGKPAHAQEAMERWQQMRGQVGELYTGHALIDLTQEKQLIRCRVTRVHFATITDAEIAAYIATGEPLNCAGCFAIEAKGGLFIEKLEGCHTNVIGLSLPLLRVMFNELGYSVTDFW